MAESPGAEAGLLILAVAAWATVCLAAGARWGCSPLVKPVIDNLG